MSEKSNFVVMVGSVQGVIHDWVLGGDEKAFTVRELSTGNLIKCIYPEYLHRKIHAATESRDSVVFVYGDIRYEGSTNIIGDISARDMEITRKLTNEEFNSLFGSKAA